MAEGRVVAQRNQHYLVTQGGDGIAIRRSENTGGKGCFVVSPDEWFLFGTSVALHTNRERW